MTFEDYLKFNGEISYKVGQLTKILYDYMVKQGLEVDSFFVHKAHTINLNLRLACHHTFQFMQANNGDKFPSKCAADVLEANMKAQHEGFVAGGLYDLKPSDFLTICNDGLMQIQRYVYETLRPDENPMQGRFIFDRIIMLFIETSCTFDLLFRAGEADSEAKAALANGVNNE